MSGFRVGFAVGNKEMIQALKSIKTHTNAGMFEHCKMLYIRIIMTTFKKNKMKRLEKDVICLKQNYKRRSYHSFILKVDILVVAYATWI